MHASELLTAGKGTQGKGTRNEVNMRRRRTLSLTRLLALLCCSNTHSGVPLCCGCLPKLRLLLLCSLLLLCNGANLFLHALLTCAWLPH